MRKILWVATVALLVVALAACGSSGSSSSGGGGNAPKVKTDKGVTDTQINVGIFNDFSGPIASIGTPAARGSEAYFDAVNAAGGVCGRKINVMQEDTKYDPQVTVQRYRADADKLLTINQLLGDASVAALKDSIARDGIMTLAGTLAAQTVTYKDVFVYETPFELEAVNGLTWASQNIKPASGSTLKIGVIYADNAYGQNGFKAVKYAVSKLPNTKLAASASYGSADKDFTAQVQKMKDAGVDVVWLHDTPQQTPLILGVAAQLGYKPMFLGNSSSWAAALAKPLAKLLDNYRMVNSVVTLGEDVPGMADLTAAVKKYFPDQALDNWMVTGWVSAAVTTAALRKACQNGDLTRAGVNDAMNGLTVDLKGIAPNPTFDTSSPDGKIPARSSRVNQIDVATGLPKPITDFFESPAAKSWTLSSD